VPEEVVCGVRGDVGGVAVAVLVFEMTGCNDEDD
jgi:hypothetical protein